MIYAINDLSFLFRIEIIYETPDNNLEMDPVKVSVCKGIKGVTTKYVSYFHCGYGILIFQASGSYII
jgi:hypothetical protein